MDAGEKVYVAFDQADRQVVAMEATKGLWGEMQDALVYKYVEADGTEHFTLSVVGIRELMRELNAGKKKPVVQLAQVQVLQVGNRVVALAEAVNADGMRWWGAASEPASEYFAVPKAVSRAQRNALRAVLPPTLLTQYITKWVREGKVKEIREEPAATTAEPLPAPPEPLPAPPEERPELPEDEAEAWRVIYRTARTIWGDTFLQKLRQIVKERFDADSLRLPAQQRQQLFAILLEEQNKR